MKKASIKLSAVVALAKENQGIWEKVRGKKAQGWSQEVGRQARRGKRKPPDGIEELSGRKLNLWNAKRFWIEEPGCWGMGFMDPHQAS